MNLGLVLQALVLPAPNLARPFLRRRGANAFAKADRRASGFLLGSELLFALGLVVEVLKLAAGLTSHILFVLEILSDGEPVYTR